MRCRSAGACRKGFAISGWAGCEELWLQVCVGRFLHSAQRTVNQQVWSLVYHRSLRMAGHYSSGETHSGWVAEACFLEVDSLEFEEMKRGYTFSLGN